MPSSFKMADLPVATNLNSNDIFLVSDITNGVSKKVTVGSLNSLLSFSQLSDYNNYLIEISTLR